MDFRDIPPGIRKMWLLDSYKKGCITREEYEKSKKEIENERERENM